MNPLQKTLLAAALLITALNAYAGRLDQIRERGELSLGYRESSLPFSYLDDQQRPVGYSLDLCAGAVEAVKQKLGLPGLKVKMVPVTSSTRIPLVANGTVDMVCGSATNTAQRQQQVAFAPTMFITYTRLLFRKESGVSDLASLKGKTVVSTAGTSSMLWLTQANAQRKLGLRLMPAKDHAEAFLAVESGRAAAFLMDDVLLAGLVANSRQPDAWAIGAETFSVEPYAVMLPRDDPEFKQLVDGAVKAMMQDGRLEKIYEKWFTQPIPPRGIKLNWPMGAALRKVFAQPTDSADPAAYQ
jgi:glutamate/aspartate transport system substrate-binding protein